MIKEDFKKYLAGFFDGDNHLFKSHASHKAYLRDCFDTFSKLSYQDVLNYCKMKEIEQTKVFTKFENKIYNRDDWSTFNINPILEFCETNNQLQIYQYYRKKVSSLPLTGVVGRAIRILVKDSITNKYIGIMCLSSDVYNLGERDSYIQKTSTVDWTIKDIKNNKLKNIANLSCCVPLQPFGFNTTGGKLLASLAFSKEVFDYYLLKYKEPLLAIITTSINGKSIQYDRLPCLKMIGYTKGYGSVNIPNELYSVCQEYNNTWKVIPKSNRIDRFNFLKNLLTHLELPHTILQHNNKRGIYFGYIFSTKLSDIYVMNELQTIHDIYTSWKDRWCKKRIDNLLVKNAIKETCDLYTNDSFIDCIKFELPKIQDKHITDDLIKEILTYKSDTYSQEHVCTILNKKYNLQLVKHDISNIYTGNILPCIQDEEYKELFSANTRKKKITDEQIYFILDYHKDINNYIKNKPPSYSVIVDTFNLKFNKKITKGTVSDVIRGKVKPNIQRKKIVNTKNCKTSDIFKSFSREQLLTIIHMKHQNKTTQEVSNYINEHYNISINRHLISKLWNGNQYVTLPNEILESEEYSKMIENKKQRTVKAKKFNDEEIEWLLKNNLTSPLNTRIKLFYEKYNKTITKAYLSKLSKI